MTPTEAIALIVSILRAREFSTRWTEFAGAVTVLISYALAVFGPKTTMAAAGPEPTDDELKECRAALEGFSDDTGTFGAEADEAVNPLVIAMVVEFAIKILTALLNRKKK